MVTFRGCIGHHTSKPICVGTLSVLVIPKASLPVWRQTFWTCLTVTRESVVLPLPSFSLKVVEDYVGFERKEAEYGGAWAMATFIEATETSDEGKRKELMDKIVAYNKEDLEATWAVFQWLRAKTPKTKQ